MTDTAKVPRKRDGGEPGQRPLIDEELADHLLDKARAEGAELLGPDGLLSQVTRAVLERALAEEMTGHLGYEKHDPAGRGSCLLRRQLRCPMVKRRPAVPGWQGSAAGHRR